MHSVQNPYRALTKLVSVKKRAFFTLELRWYSAPSMVIGSTSKD